MGGAGHPAIRTPTLDSLAGAGVRYTNAYAECPVCIPARRTLMTGATTRTHGDRVFKVQEPMPQLPTVAQTFRDAGYQAYAVGKLHIFPSAIASASTTSSSPKRAVPSSAPSTTTSSGWGKRAIPAAPSPTA